MTQDACRRIKFDPRRPNMDNGLLLVVYEIIPYLVIQIVNVCATTVKW